MRIYLFLIPLLLLACSEEEGDGVIVPEPVDDNLHSAVLPVAKPEAWWQALHNEDQSLLNQNSYELLFLGNSIIFNWETTGQEVWQARYASNALNMGIGSDRTQHLLWRIEDIDFGQANPQLAVLLIGTNNTNGNVNSIAEVADGVIACIEVLRDKLPTTKILTLGIFPRGEVSSQHRFKVEQINSIIAQVADNEHVFYADYGYLFLHEHGSINTDLISDTVHPNLLGYQLWADEMDELIASITNQ